MIQNNTSSATDQESIAYMTTNKADLNPQNVNW